MTWVLCVAIICVSRLIGQYLGQRHESAKKGDLRLIGLLETRVAALEHREVPQFDPKAFKELESKVDALRIARGLRGGNGA